MQDLLIIKSGGHDRNYWNDLWRYRELFAVLARRDLSVRYKQTAIGVLWAVIRPVLTAVVFTFVFAKLAKLPTEGSVPYPLLVFVGTLAWTFFSTGLADASNSVVNSTHLITKVYFPRLIIPAAVIVVALVDFFVSLAVLVLLMWWYQFLPGWQVLFFPLFVLFAILVTIGPALWVTALNVKYRDVRYVIPVLVQFGLFLSPVGFSSNVVPTDLRLLYSLNPMVGIIDGFRWCLLGGQNALYWPGIGLGLSVAFIFLWLGISRFRAMEKSFADLI